MTEVSEELDLSDVEGERAFRRMVDQWFAACDDFVPDMFNYLINRAAAEKLLGITVLLSATTDKENEKAVVGYVHGCGCTECEAAAMQSLKDTFAKRRKVLAAGSDGMVH